MTAAGYPMHQTTIAKMEGGNRPTTVGEVSAIAAIFGIPMAAFFDTYEGQGYEDLAVLSNQLAALTAEKIKLGERLVALDAETASVQMQYDDLQRQVEQEEDQAREEAEQERYEEEYLRSAGYAEDMEEQRARDEGTDSGEG
jgi:hypothetical protein